VSSGSPNATSRQRLAAILAADAAGYSRLMAVDEQATMAALDAAREVFRSQIEAQQGRVIDMAGDSVLAVFETATGAVAAAIAIQAQLEDSTAGVPADRRMRFRIGVHLGDVSEKNDGTIYGDGVNIAARLEGLALLGGITVSDAVQGAVRHRIAATFEDLGEQQVKNIADPLRVFRVKSTTVPDDAGRRASAAPLLRGWVRAVRARWWALGCLVLLAVVAMAFGLREPVRHSLAEIAGVRSATPPDAAAAPITMSLAVGSFTTATESTPASAAAASLRDDLLGAIGSVERHVRVVAVAPGALPSGEFRERARQAGARYVVEGDLRSGASVGSTGLRLIETQRGTQVWSHRFDLPEPAASFEGSAARRRMVDQLAGAIVNAEITRVLAKPPEQLDAMELVVRAWSVGDTQSVANAREMRKLLDRALALEPTLVPALHLAFGQVDMLNDVDPHPDHERYVRESDQFSARAVTLDPGNSRAWNDRAVALELLGRWSASLEASQRAIDLDPFSTRAYQVRAWLLNMMGRPAEALPLADKALLLDPSQSWSLRVACEAHLLLGEADKAIATCERSSGLDRDFIHHSFLAAAYANTGDIEHARVALRAMLETVPGYTIAQLKAKRYSDHPEYQKLAERYWYDGLRKAGLAEK
jgi:adenylate cyclase